MKPIKVGIIGCGHFSTAQHMPNCRDLESLELWHCCDLSEERRQAAKQFGAQKTTADYKEVLADAEVDLVILAVPHDLHTFFIEETVKAKKHVLCEKPMTMAMDESYRVIKGVQDNNVKLCVDYNRRFSPAMIDLKRAFQEHKKGPRSRPRVYVAETGRSEWAEEQQSSILIRIQDESLTYGGVHIDWQEGGGEIMGESCHWLDLMCWLMEQRPVRIFGMGSSRLDHILNLEFADGSLGCLHFGTHGSFEYPKELFEIQSHGKIFRSESFVENQYFGCGDRTTKIFPPQHDFQPEHGKQGGHAGYLEKIDAMGIQFEKTGNFDYVFPDKGHVGLLEAFADTILHDKPSPIDERAGMRATYLCLRAVESIKTGMPLPIDIADWDMYVH